jgi:thiamine-phosphate pyrophosphorylase
MSLASGLRLIVISDTEQGPLEAWLGKLESLLAGARRGSVLVLLRDRQLPLPARRELGQRLRQVTQAWGHGLSVGDRLDLAVLLDADGVHLSEDSVSVDDARAFGAAQGRSWLVSAACHAPEGLAVARADAVLLSPVVEARKGRPALGLAGIERALHARRQRAPGLGPCRLFALGGVTRHNAGELLAAGAEGVALIGELSVPGAIPSLLQALGNATLP